MHLGLIGYGSIAQSLISLVPVVRVPQVTVLVRPYSLERARATYVQAAHTPKITFVTNLDALMADKPAAIVECAGHSAVAEHATNILKAGTDLIVASVGAFADHALHTTILAASKRGKAKFIIPTGAVGGLDLLRVLSARDTVEVTYRGIKPPAAWKGSPADKLTNLDNMEERTVFFRGTGRAAAKKFPKNANVVAALALAGGGFDSMKVELVADPNAQANVHAYEASSALCSYKIEIENAATPGNARTSMTTVLSILHEIMTYIANTPEHEKE